jgi:hypothetical protein
MGFTEFSMKLQSYNSTLFSFGFLETQIFLIILMENFELFAFFMVYKMFCMIKWCMLFQIYVYMLKI